MGWHGRIKHMPLEMTAVLLTWLTTPSNIMDSVCWWEASVGSWSCRQLLLAIGSPVWWAWGLEGILFSVSWLKEAVYQWEACGLSTPSPGQQWELAVTDWNVGVSVHWKLEKRHHTDFPNVAWCDMFLKSSFQSLGTPLYSWRYKNKLTRKYRIVTVWGTAPGKKAHYFESGEQS